MERVGIEVTMVSPRWRTATLALVALLISSWAYLGYWALDSGVSLSYCRSEQDYMHHDIQFLVVAATRHLSSRDFLEVRAKQEPELPARLDEGNTLLLRSVTLQFGEDALLKGLAAQ